MLPSLDPVDAVIQTDDVLRIHLGEVPPEGIESPKFKKSFTQIKEHVVWFDVPNIARFLVTNGKDIMVEPYTDVDEDTLAIYILGSCMGAILHQRGLLVLHANAIEISQGVAILFVGDSGAGKSTAAAQFQQQGYKVLSDDVVAIDEQGCVINGLPYIKLWQQTLQNLNIPHSNLQPVRQQLNKFKLPITQLSNSNSPKVKAIYNLNVQTHTRLKDLHLSDKLGIDRFTCLTQNVYRADAITGLNLKSQHLKQCSLLAQNAHIVEINRPSAYFCAPEMVGMVLEDLKHKKILK